MKTLKIDGEKVDSFSTDEELTAYLAECIINCPDNSLTEKQLIDDIENDYQRGFKTENERNNAIVSDITTWNDGIYFQR